MKYKPSNYGHETLYEWSLDQVFADDNEVFQSDFADKLSAFINRPREETIDGHDFIYELTLVRRDTDDNHGFAYLNPDGIFPERFDDGFKVPKRFLQEYERNKHWASKFA